MLWHTLTTRLAWSLLLPLAALVSGGAGAEVLDEINVFPERGDAVVRITFSAGIQYLRHTPVDERLVEIYFQVLTADRSTVTETRRLPATASFPGVEVTYAPQPRTQLQKLTVRFTRPVPFRVRPAGSRAIDLVIEDAGKDVARAATPPAPGDERGTAADRFAIRLDSFASPAEMDRAPVIPGEFSDYTVFVSGPTQHGRGGYDLLLGHFASEQAAEEARQRLLRRFPRAEVVDLAPPAREPAPGPPAAPPVSAAPGAQPAPPTATPPATPPVAAAEVEARAEQLMAQARPALEAGNYAVSIERLNQVLLLPPNSQSQEAQELIGLARERNGETEKARAEYELYLKLFPEGGGATRVRKRLAALAAPEEAPTRRAERAPVRTSTGTLSQYYYGGRTKVESVFNTPTTVDRSSFSATDQSALVTNIDLTLRNRTAGSDNRFVLRDTSSASFLDTPDSYNRLNAAYYDYRGLDNPVTARLGRQTGLTGGLPNRFDGAIGGVAIAQKWRVNAVAGAPVEYPSIDAKRRFWGTNLEYTGLGEAWSGNFYYFDQTVDGVVDRRAVGNETRYFRGGTSLFTLLDYDTSYKEWNIAMAQGTWQTEGRTTFNVLYDRRKAPLLATTNAILGQATTSIATLLQSLTLEQVRQQARDVTATATQALVGFTTPVSEKWMAGADARLTNVGPLPAVVVNGVLIPAQPATGNIYSYDLQAIGTNLYSPRDTSVFTATYLDGPTQKGRQLAYNNLSLLAARWTLEPSLRYYTQTDIFDVKLTRWTPGLRLTYRLRESLALEGEYNWEKSATVGPSSRDDSTRSFYYLGFRWDL